jgi:polygalacturonase
VILTGENGDFSASGYPSGFNGLGVAGKGSDEGSATLDVSKNAFIGTQATAGNVTYTPNNFYAEYLTLQNTFDTDATTTTTWTATSNGGTCSTGSTAHTLQYLYNNNLLCGAQAMALFLNSDGAVLNNVNLLGQQDTLYASGLGCGTYCTVAREYMWKGLISGDVDYTFGDAALVFDHTNFFTTWHGLTATGQETITAQNKRFATGTTASTNSSAPTSTDYLSGFICNACTLMSQSTGMTKLYYGRPYDISTSSYPSSYSTWIMLNSAVDQVNSAGWIGWDGASQYLSTSTYGEFNTMSYTDPTPGTGIYPYSIFNSTPSLLYSTNSGNSTAGSLLPTGGNTGSGTALGSREGSAIALNAGTAAQYYPVAFLSTTVPSTKLSTGQSSNWNPVAALAAQVNSFVPVSSLGGVTLGSSVTILGRPQTPGAGIIPTGSYQFLDGTTVLASGNLDASGEAYLTTSSLGSGTHNITMTYGGDSNFTASTSSVYSILVLQSGQAATATALNVANTSSTIGSTISGTVSVTPAAAAGTVSVYLDGSVATSCVLTSGSCTWSISGPATGSHSMFASFPSSATYGQSASSNVSLYVSKPVATGDTRTVTEPSFPAVCQSLAATLVTDVTIQDLDASVDATTSNIDGARIQAALNACSAQAVAANSSLAVELSMDSTGTDNAFLSGPLSMPSNVTLLVDPNVTLYFSRNVQDYDKLSGTHTCGTVNGASATSSCLPLIDIPATSTNVGIMGFGKLNGRGGDPLMNGFATATYAAPSSYTWWNLSAQANGEGNQQNPRFIQMEAGSSNITLYKITILNSPMFHVSTQGAVNNFTAWDVKIVTPTAARNTDGIDPANVINGTVTQSWISDGDDNIAVSAPGTTAPAKNISITNNHFFAGHGESIGSYTGAGVSNILYDHNMSAGNAWGSTTSQWGSAVSASGSFTNGVADGNSTAIRIKTANDRGGLVTGIQYSNSCFLDHYTDIQFTPYYSSGDSTSELPSYTNILLQNLVFTTDNTKSGSVELTGEFNTNNGTPVTNPLYLTMDNVTFSSILSTLVNSSSPVETWSGGNSSGGTGQYTNLTVGPGQVSSNFLSAYNSLVATSSNNDTLTNNASLSSLDPPVCTVTYLAPELTGPTGLPQTIQYGNTATLDVILTPAVGGAAFPNGTVTLTDALTNNTFTGTFSGKGDTLAAVIPASDLPIGTHTFSVTAYSGDTNYTVPPSYQAFGSYNVTVVQAAQSIAFAPSVTSYVYAPGLTIPLSATATSGLTVSFASTTTGVCTVSGTTATILSIGTCTIQASQAGNSNYLAAPVAAVNYSIAQVPQRIASISPASGSTYTYTPGMTITLSATATSGLSVSFASTTTGVCTVSGTTATILSAGACTIQASQAGNTEYSASSSVSASYAIVNPLPAVSSISPASTSSGAAAFTLTVSGSGFVPGSTIYWGSNPLTTTYVNGTTLTGPVSATDITIPGIMPVTVQTTTPGGGTSNAMQFEIDSITVGTSSVPTIATTTATVVAGSTATYPVTVPTTVTITSVSCLNLPAGATCNYSASTGLTNIVTSSTTPAGTYNVTVVFAETVTTTTAAAGLLPILLLPLFFLRRKLAVKSISFCLGVILLAGAALTIGCGGSSKSTAQSTTQSTSSAVVKLVVQ